MRKYLFIGVLLAITFESAGDPIDTAYDLMEAIEFQDGYALEGLLTEDLYGAITGFLDQARDIIAEDPALAGSFLARRYGDRISLEDFEFLTNEEILGKILGEATLMPEWMIENESATLEGRTATVVLTYQNGASVSFALAWENSGWRISDSSLLGTFFR